jgi:hypothetical protein
MTDHAHSPDLLPAEAERMVQQLADASREVCQKLPARSVMVIIDRVVPDIPQANVWWTNAAGDIHPSDVHTLGGMLRTLIQATEQVMDRYQRALVLRRNRGLVEEHINASEEAANQTTGRSSRPDGS